MKDFMKTIPNRKSIDLYLRHATPETYRSVLNEIKNMEIYNMLVDTKSEHVNHFLRGVSYATIHSIQISIGFIRDLFPNRYYSSK